MCNEGMSAVCCYSNMQLDRLSLRPPSLSRRINQRLCVWVSQILCKERARLQVSLGQHVCKEQASEQESQGLPSREE